MSYTKQGFVDGQKLTAEHLNHIEDGIEGASKDVSWDDLTEKPFGKETDTITVVENITIAAGATYSETTYKFVAGQSCKVTFDGVEYDMVAENWDSEYNGIGGMWGNYSTYPFGIYTSDYIDGISLYAQTDGEHTVTIISEVTEVHQISIEYIPNEITTDIATASDMASNARSLANRAQTTANKAQTTANEAIPVIDSYGSPETSSIYKGNSFGVTNSNSYDNTKTGIITLSFENSDAEESWVGFVYIAPVSSNKSIGTGLLRSSLGTMLNVFVTQSDKERIFKFN